MQAFGETLFDVVYLVLVITVGIKMIRQSKEHPIPTRADR